MPELRRRGIDSVVHAFVWDQSGPLVNALRAHHIETSVHAVAGSTQDRISSVISGVKQSAADIFVANHVVPALFAARWIQKCGVPSLAVLHSDDPFYRAVLDVFIAGRKRDRIQNVVGVSQCLQQLAEHAATDQNGVHYLPYGVQVPSPSPKRLENPGLRIAYAGRLVQEQKRILDVAHAMQRCVSEITGCSGVLIGDGTEMSAVADLLRKQVHCGAIELTVRLVPAEVQTHLSTADVLLLLSDYEGLP
ncbi:MAG: glycosyltransferase family 4 protein, partial [Planctomycetaceae bacterium]